MIDERPFGRGPEVACVCARESPRALTGANEETQGSGFATDLGRDTGGAERAQLHEHEPARAASHVEARAIEQNRQARGSAPAAARAVSGTESSITAITSAT